MDEKEREAMNIVSRILVAGLVVVCGLVLTARASSIVMKNGRTVTGKTIEWRESTRDYLVNNEGASMPVPEDQVVKIEVDKPAELEQARGLVASGRYTQALPLLEGVAKGYKKLSWDIDALKLLVQCYVELNDIKKVSGAMDALFAAGGTASPQLQMSYFRALQKAGDTKRLQQELSRTLGSGTASLVAVSYLMRANLYMQEGNQDAALSDFLKIVTLFKGEKLVQPEALYNVAQLLEKAKDPRAAEFRKILAADYKNSEFANKK